MEENLKIVLGAETQPLEKGLAQAQQSLNKFGASAKSTGFAVTNLSRIVQDAPFGFIAIQNNLDPLIQSFGQLKRETGSTGAALSSLFGALAGPAGIALGFAAVSAALTTAIQKYGSFGAVVSKVLGTATEEQLLYNKAIVSGSAAVGEQIARIEGLSRALQSTSLSTTNIADANRLLASEIDKVIVSINFQKEGIKGASGELIDYAKKVLLARNQLVAFGSVFGELQKELVQTTLDGVSFGDKFTAAIDKIGVAIDLLRAGRFKELRELTKIDFLEIAEKRFEQRLANIRKRQQELLSLQDKFIQDQTREGIRLIDLFGGPEEKSATAPKASDVPKAQIADFSKFYARDFVTSLDQSVDAEFQKINPFTPPTANRPFDAIDLITANLNLQEFNASQERIRQFQEAQQKAILERNRRNFEQLKQQQAEFTNILSQGLALPLGDLIFNVLDKGAAGFKGFADAAINAIKRIVAQLVATKIIQLLASLTPFGKGVKLGQGLGNLLGSGFGFIGRTAAPSFGGGGLSGGVNLTGQVVFVQRGSDLVGVLSRSNNRINRVG